MSKTAKLRAREVWISLALIAVLLVTLAVVVAKRFIGSHQSEVADVGMDAGTVTTEVIPAKFHGTAGAPTVLKAQASADRSGYGLGAALDSGHWSSPAGSVLPRDADDTARRNYMPKLPLVSPLQGAAESSGALDAAESSDAFHAARPGYGTLDGTAAADGGPSTVDRQTAQGVPRPLRVSDGGENQSHAFGTAVPDELAAPSSSRPIEPTAAIPGAPSVPRQQPASANLGRHTVEPGDSMWAISEKAYGTGAFFKALVEHNRNRLPTPHDLAVGEVVLTPDVGFLRKHYPSLCPKPRHRQPETPAATTVRARGGRTYLVEEGDTLSIIARYELGDGDRWREIYQLNREVLGDDFNYLRPGMRLVLPSRSKPAPITRRPTPEIRRY